MKNLKIEKRNWDLKEEKKIGPIKKSSNFNKLVPNEKSIKKNTKKENKETNFKLSESDNLFLEEFEKDIKEAEYFSGNFNIDTLNKFEKNENILYEELINILRKIENINIENYHSNINIIFKKGQYKKFINIKDKLKKEFFFNKIKEKKIYYTVKKIQKIDRELFLKKNSKDSIIDIKNLNKIYESKTNNNFVLKNINLSIKKGEFVILVGPSGSGKTTLMNIISGIDKLTYGEIIVNEENISKYKENELTKFRLKNIGYIFQNYGLIGHLTVEENISLGCYMKYLSKKTKEKISYDNYINKQEVNKILEILSIDDISNKMPYQLSGGQKQRVSIGRSIAKRSPIIFADEPTSSLDELNANKIIEILKEINTKFKTTIIMVTHNDKEVNYASRVIKLKDGQIQ